MAPSTSSISNTFHILKQEGYRVTDCNSISHPQLLFLCLTNSSFSLIAYMLGKPNKNFDFYNYFILIADYFLHKNKSKITLIKCKDFFPPERRSYSSIGRNYLGWLPWHVFFTIQERHISRPHDLIINVIDIIDKLQVILQKLLLLNFLCRIMYFWYSKALSIYWQAESQISRKFEGYFCSNYLQIESWIWILFPVARQCGGTYQGFCHQFETKEIFNSKSLGEMQLEESRHSLFCGFCIPSFLELAHS